jgi:uncharacterized alkaline shock family protein YloU
MAIEFEQTGGKIRITEEVIAAIAGSVTVECQGLVGMASKNKVRDGIAELLGRGTFSRGIDVHYSGQALHVDLYVIVHFGTKISEVALDIQAKVKHVLEHVSGVPVDAINVFVQGVRLRTP